MARDPRISRFLEGSPHAVVGASADRDKYGNKVFRAFLQNSRIAIPVNPAADEIEGVKAYPDLASISVPLHGVSIVTPPQVSEKIIPQAVSCGIKNVWLQPGAENDATLAIANKLGISLIFGGPCILVTLQYLEK